MIGSLQPAQSWLSSPEFMALADPDAPVPDGMIISEDSDLIAWQSFWIMTLRNVRYTRPASLVRTNGTSNVEQPVDSTALSLERIIGALGIWAREPQIDLTANELHVFEALCRRAGRVLSDVRLQGDIFATLQGLLPEMDALQQLRGPARYGNAPALAKSDGDGVATLDSSELADLIHDALRDYWGGPRLTESRLLALNVVKHALAENDDNATRAVRAVLTEAI
jgi:hypothetical protein